MITLVTLYSNGCPRCDILEKKLKDKGIEYIHVTDVEEMLSLGFKDVPKLEVDGEIMDFGNAIKWVNER